MQQMHMHIYLHPTMYLLIQQPKTYRQLPQGHLHPTMYLLIPDKAVTGQLTVTNLHPTMYLLIPFFCLCLSFVMYYLHPTMYLLIRAKLKRIYVALEFTSHYVSINSCKAKTHICRIRIYIPLCIY